MLRDVKSSGTTTQTTLVHVHTEIIMYHLAISCEEHCVISQKGIEPKTNPQFPTSKGNI